jgi:hypothetical protein
MKKYVDRFIHWIYDTLFFDIKEDIDGAEKYNRSTSILLSIIAVLLIFPLNINVAILKVLLLMFILCFSFVNLHRGLAGRYNESTLNYSKVSLALSGLSLLIFIVKILVLLSIAL